MMNLRTAATLFFVGCVAAMPEYGQHHNHGPGSFAGRPNSLDHQHGSHGDFGHGSHGGHGHQGLGSQGHAQPGFAGNHGGGFGQQSHGSQGFGQHGPGIIN